jgi:glutamate dehydrogenase
MRRIAAEATAHGTGAAAVTAWMASKDGAERVRAAIHEIAASGLTLAKLSVAASMLGDIARTT